MKKNERKQEGYLECSSCGSIFITVSGPSWNCRRCKSYGSLEELRKYMQENPDKLHLD
jgi:hypothetical protein